MLHRIDRVAVVILAALVGLAAIVPGWTIMTSGTAGGYRLPMDLLRGYAPFSDYVVPGVILLVVIGLGGVLTAAVNVADARRGPFFALAYGLVLVGWIVGELVFMTQTMVLTWLILGVGVVLIALALPGVLRADARPHGGRGRVSLRGHG
jgi:hypothetical protein